MNILQLCNKFPYPAKDGGAIAVLNLTKSLSSLGSNVTVLAMNTSKHNFDLKNLPDDVKNIADFYAVDIDTSIKNFTALLCLCQNKSYHIERFISPTFNDRLIELLHEKEFNIIQLEGLYLAPYVETIRAFSKATIVMRTHNIEHEIWEMVAKNEKIFFKRIYLAILARQLRNYELARLNKYDLIIPISQPDADKLNALGCKLPMHVCSATYNETALKPDKSKMEFPSLFFIGALDWVPNIEGLNWFLNNVWPKVNDQFPDLKFYIAGRSANNAKLCEMKNVIVVGEVENAYDFMNSKGIMIVPLLSGSGIRVKIIEGMALGKTIISTSLGAEGIPCKDGQNILLADTPQAFVEKITKCINEKITYSIIGDNAQQFAKRQFSSQEVVKKLLEFFQQHLAAT
jgi:polysaccharide biosynthesis protein PslH